MSGTGQCATNKKGQTGKKRSQVTLVAAQIGRPPRTRGIFRGGVKFVNNKLNLGRYTAFEPIPLHRSRFYDAMPVGNAYELVGGVSGRPALHRIGRINKQVR